MTTYESNGAGESRPEEVTVEMFDWKQATGDTVLVTTGLGPCIGIAIHDADSQTGHLAHFPAPHDGKQDVDDLLQSATSGVADPSRLKAWVRGGGLDGDPEGVPVWYTKLGRQFVIDKLSQAGVQDVDVEWSGDDVSSVNMDLNCATGECTMSANAASDMEEFMGPDEWDEVDRSDWV